MEKYYKAYDDRYRRIHALGLQWSDNAPTELVSEIIREFNIPKNAAILEIGCGEGRDAAKLLSDGYNLKAVDVSKEAVNYCRRVYPDFADSFSAADCLYGEPDGKFAFIYSVAVLHMLVDDGDRRGFYRYIREHLADGGVALIAVMGDGEAEYRSDPKTAFDLQTRVHGATGRSVEIAATSCRVVNGENFEREISENGLKILRKGMSCAPPDFSSLMYAAVGVR